MPHVIVKLYPGRSDEQKKELADALTQTLIQTLKSKETARAKELIASQAYH